MKNGALAAINFREILEHGGQPDVQYRYKPSLPCQGYCVDCEETGILERTGGRLDLMSHGCDSSDFEAILGKMTPSPAGVEVPVLFLLEDPGRTLLDQIGVAAQ